MGAKKWDFEIISLRETFNNNFPWIRLSCTLLLEHYARKSNDNGGENEKQEFNYANAS